LLSIVVAQFFLIAELLLFAALNSQFQERELLIDNFDRSNKLQLWSFSNGPEFPGASGTLSLGQGHEGRGGVLTYRFNCLDETHCGHYVAAIWKATSPVEVSPGTVLSFWVRLSPDVRLIARVTDQTDQTLQFDANAPTLEYPSPDEWQPILVPITSKPAGHWGGANNGHIQGRIVGIAILAELRYGHPSQGQMTFDDLRLLKTADMSLHLDRAAAVIAPPPGDKAELRPRLGVNIHFLKDDRALDLAREAGFSFVRTDLLWANLEKHHQYDFSPFDDLMRSLEARGMGVLWLLAYGHPEHGGQSPQSDKDIAAYSRYAAAVVAHFRGHNARFEIWNEPNAKQFLAKPAIYPALLRTALDSIRSHDPDAMVSTGGTSGFDFPFLASMLESGSARKASALAVHPYRDAGPETLPGDLLLLRHLIQRTVGRNMPVWDTEWGYSSYANFPEGAPSGGHSEIARRRQAVLVTRECLTLWVLGLPVTVFYDLQDDGANPFDREHNFGLLNQDNSDKPAIKALRVLTGATRDHAYSGLIRDVPYSMHAVRLDGASDVLFIVWNDDTKMRPRVRLSSDGLLSVRNVLGEPIVSERDELFLDEGMGPIYVRLKSR
jgi:Cellulase (glycosyl hydrolase family 5)